MLLGVAGGRRAAAGPGGHRVAPGTEYQFSLDYPHLSADPATDANAPAWLAQHYSHVLLDPPRAGALSMLPHIARLAPERLLYVACDPDSMARDIGLLVQRHGFELLAAGVVDMFPHTAHVESLAVLAPGSAHGH